MTDPMITSAALYFGSHTPQRVPLTWFERAMEFFASQEMSIDVFYGFGGCFSLDEIYDFPKHKVDLINAVKNGDIESLGLYSNPVGATLPVSAWQALASVEMENGMTFLGIDDVKVAETEAMLRSAHLMWGGLLGVKYGISYKQLLSKGPGCYAAGVQLGSLVDIKNWLVSEDDGNRRLTAWRNERYGSRRYLTGLFRGAYPASIISSEHLAALKSLAPFREIPGKITPLVEDKLWMWELTDSEMIVAENLLRKGSVLVSN